MSIKDWKDKELNSLLNERWGFSMDLNKLNESNCNSAGKKDDEEKCPKCEAKPCHCDVKKEEKDKEEPDEESEEGLTPAQKKLPAELKKAIAKKKGLNLKDEKKDSGKEE